MAKVHPDAHLSYGQKTLHHSSCYRASREHPSSWDTAFFCAGKAQNTHAHMDTHIWIDTHICRTIHRCRTTQDYTHGSAGCVCTQPAEPFWGQKWHLWNFTSFWGLFLFFCPVFFFLRFCVKICHKNVFTKMSGPGNCHGFWQPHPPSLYTWTRSSFLRLSPQAAQSRAGGTMRCSQSCCTQSPSVWRSSGVGGRGQGCSRTSGGGAG